MEKVSENFTENLYFSTLPDMFNRSAYRFGDRRCQWYQPDPFKPTETAFLTYSDTYLKVKDLSCGLMSMGITPGDRVAIMSYNCPQWLWADFAILGSGAVTVTIYPSFSVNEIKYIVNNSGSRVAFVRDEDGAQKMLGILGDMPTLEKVIIMSERASVPDHDKFVPLQQVIDQGRRYEMTHPYAYQKACDVIRPWDLATIVYTSGTTGNPKGAMHTHHTFMSANAADILRFAEGGVHPGHEIQLSFLPLSHTYERQCCQMYSIFTGSTIAYAEQPATVIRDIQIFNPTWFCAVPRIFERLYVAMRDAASATPEGKAGFEKAMEIGLRVVDHQTDEDGFVDFGYGRTLFDGLPDDLRAEYEWADTNVFSKVRALLGKNYRYSCSASASFPARLCKLFMAMGVKIIEGYGLTETMNAINFSVTSAILPGSMGPETAFNEVKLAEDGEILVRGGNVFLGYYNNPEATAEAFDADGFFHTGDIGKTVFNKKLGKDYYIIIDRKKAIMVLDTGKNVPRAKVESRFTAANYVEQVCAVADDQKFVGAVIVPKFDRILQALAAEGITFDEKEIVKIDGLTVKVGTDFSEHPRVRALVEFDVAEANKGLEDYEAVKDYHVSNRVFMPDLDEMTPTLKIKFRNVLKNFAADIEKLYKKH
ncbi:MAG: AMP-dependent synthetase/ligase [Deltaproteobacteria bacterium]